MRKKNRFLLLLLGTFVAFSSLSASLPKPVPQNQAVAKEVVVLLHGLGRSNTAMWLLATRLKQAGFLVERVGYRSLTQSPNEIVQEVSRKIDECCPRHRQKVHFVGHSLGDLLIRAYLQEHLVDHLGRVVLVGTPNRGTELVDRFRDNWLFPLLGPTTAALGTDDASLPSRLSEPYYPVGVIAGFNDSDRNDHLLPGRDDGLVPVESTKLDGMSDFIEVESGHSMMRYDTEVARQMIAFLKYGKFSHTADERSNRAYCGQDAKRMKQATHFTVQRGWKLLISDMGLNPADVLKLAGLPADLFSRKDASLSPADYFRLWQGLEQAAGTEKLPLMILETAVDRFDYQASLSLLVINLFRSDSPTGGRPLRPPGHAPRGV